MSPSRSPSLPLNSKPSGSGSSRTGSASNPDPSDGGAHLPSVLPEPPFRIAQFLRLLEILLGPLRLPLVGWTCVMAFVFAVQTLAAPYVIGLLVDLFAGPGATANTAATLYWLAAALALVSITEAVLRVNAKPRLAAICLEASYRAKVVGFERLMDRPVAWHEDELTGSKVQRISAGGGSLYGVLDMLHSSILGVAVTFVSVCGYFLYADLAYFLYALAYIALFSAIQILFMRKDRTLIKASNVASEKASGTYVEAAGNLLTIKTLKLESNISRKVATGERTATDLVLAGKRLAFRKHACFMAFDGLTSAGFAILAGHAVLEGALAPGMFLVVFTYFRSLYTAVNNTFSFLDGFMSGWLTVGRLAPLLLDGSSSTPGTRCLPSGWEAIELADVRAPYGNGKGGVRDLTVRIARGEHVGIVGRSGAGKSSFGKVLTGILPVESGTYSIGGVQYHDIFSSERAEKISTVLQDSELFNMTLAENIAVMREVTPETLARAVRIAQLEPVVRKLKDGLGQLIGERGYRLSGGERQRVGIARAVCKHPEILVLDEATSALDGETEAAIHEALRNELRDTTLLIIAHRLSTLRGVDRILVFEDGRVVEDGAPDELLRKPGGVFAGMCALEQRRAEPES